MVSYSTKQWEGDCGRDYSVEDDGGKMERSLYD